MTQDETHSTVSDFKSKAHATDEYLKLCLVNDNEEHEEITQTFPFAVSNVITTNILGARKLSSGDDVKEIYSLELSNNVTSYEPGDTIGIVTENKQNDINHLFKHIGVLSLADKKIKILSIYPLKPRELLQLPYINKVTSLNTIFKYFINIHCLPKKVLIKKLSQYTTDVSEKNYLEKLCSKEGSDLYQEKILETNMTFLNFILKFKTCTPPVERLLENLPCLLPRPYSIASSPLSSTDRVKIVFSVIKTRDGQEGLCTGMLKSLLAENKENKVFVKMFFRKSNGFNLPLNNNPLILIGPGTGIAPFIGFLEHRKAQKKVGKIWLFYGCRYEQGDFLFKEELQEFLDSKILTKLLVALSRDKHSEAKYVQDNLKKYGKDIIDLILKENALIYVCGDAKNMIKDIKNSFLEIFENHGGMSHKNALIFLKQLQNEKRYFQDAWI